MNVAVCFKGGPDADKIINEDWEKFDLSIDLRYAGYQLNGFDESALEMAIRIKQTCMDSGEKVSLSAITVGKSIPQAVYQTLYAAGYDEVIIIGQGENFEFRSNDVADELALFIRSKEFSLVLMGKQAGFADTGTVPYLLAKALNFPVVSEAVEVIWLNEELLQINREADGGIEKLVTKVPIVVSVGNSPIAALRAVSLRDKLASSKKVPLCITSSTVSCRENLNFFKEEYDKNCQFIDSEDIYSMAKRVAEEHLLS